jgi:hypothetical protein
MRAFAVEGDTLRLCLADVDAELEDAVLGLGFERQGALYVRSFAGGSPAVAARFEQSAEAMVRQAARLDPVPWDDALALVAERAAGQAWLLLGSAALAVRGAAVEPRDIDLVTETAAACDAIAHALDDVLIEPLGDGGWLAQRWFRAFAGARIECAGAPHDAALAEYDETVEWRGHALRLVRERRPA